MKIARVYLILLKKIFGHFFYFLFKKNLLQFIYTGLSILLLYFWLSNNTTINSISKKINKLYPEVNYLNATIDVNYDELCSITSQDFWIALIKKFECIIETNGKPLSNNNNNNKSKDIYFNILTIKDCLISSNFLNYINKKNILLKFPFPIFIEKLRL